METKQLSNYEKYLLMCAGMKRLSPTYSAYMEFKELYTIVRRLSTNGSGQYMYNNEMHKSPISSATATQVLKDFDSAIFNSSVLPIVYELKLRIF